MNYRRRRGLGWAGELFVNQCRTNDNIDGWVIGTGNGQSFLKSYSSITDPDQKTYYDIQLQHADGMRAQGYGCPNSPDQVAALRASSPFVPNSGYVAPVAPATPLLPGWGGGALPAGAAAVTPAGVVPVIPVTPAGQRIINSSGAAPVAVADTASSAFSFSSIPWWGWAAGAGVALFAFGGGRGR